MISAIKKHALFGIVFTIAKATVYFVPLILADVLSKSDFGILEYALAGLGLVVNTLFNLGVPGAYPYFIIRKKQTDVKLGFVLHPLILIIPFICNQVAYFIFNLDIAFYLAFNISYIISNQVFYSIKLKSHERSSLAVVFDSGVYILLLISFILYKVGIIDLSISVLNIFILCYCLCYVLFSLSRVFSKSFTQMFTAYKTILNFSVHLLFSTFLIFLITTSGRILVEFFFGFEEVGIYAFYFRLAAIVVMIHQVVNIAFFKKIYTLDPVKLDNYFFLFFILISILSILIYIISPYIVLHLSSFFENTFESNKGVYFLLSAQMVMWIASALNSNIVDRENLARKNNPSFVVLIFLVVVCLYLLNNKLTFSNLVYIHFTTIYMACIIQYYTLSKKKIVFKKSAITLSLTFITQSIIYFTFF
ncbi:hypothetical protein [Winogradskyella flava]|uniref:hypothetical protein n=1 Tax=Winogradskyella flava TaxID=1884876 RepID=UPI00248FF799|nr:hypothetical protein [Winogradskyella flava]